MPNQEEIEQLLRNGFPQIDGEFIDDGPSENLRGRYRLRGGSLQVLLEQNSWWVAWQATLEDGHAWTLDAEEGSTPAEAISNLQVAIAQVGAINAAVNQLSLESSQNDPPHPPTPRPQRLHW